MIVSEPHATLADAFVALLMLVVLAPVIGVCALLVNWALCFAALSVVGKTLPDSSMAALAVARKAS